MEDLIGITRYQKLKDIISYTRGKNSDVEWFSTWLKDITRIYFAISKESRNFEGKEDLITITGEMRNEDISEFKEYLKTHHPEDTTTIDSLIKLKEKDDHITIKNIRESPLVEAHL